MKEGAFKEHVHAWLRLLRAPNLFTAPGDPVAGFLLAGGAANDVSLLLAALSSLFAYMFGIVANDIADFEEDAKERPDRPLPSGKVNPVHAKMAAGYLALSSAALAACAGIACLTTCLALLAAIALYDFNKKVRSCAGPAALGFCRAASLLLGASAASTMEWPWNGLEPELIAAIAIFIYIFGVSMAAKDETKELEARQGRKRFMLGALGCGVFASWTAGVHARAADMDAASSASLCLAALSSLILVIEAARHFRAMGEPMSPKETQDRIGGLIGLLIFAQVALCAAAGSILWPLALMAMSPIAKRCAAKFYGS